MNKKQFWALFICSLSTWFVGASIMPILPIYAKSLGATPIMTGNYLSISFLALTLGTMSASGLVALFKRRRELILFSALVCLPATWCMGQATNIWQLAALTVIVWFMAGIALTLESVIAGLFASESTRGRLFGLLMATASLAGLIGGIVVGPIIDGWGYERMFALVSLVFGLQALSALFLPDKPVTERPVPVPSEENAPVPGKRALADRSFLLLFSASLLSGVAVAIMILGRSLAVSAQGHPLTVITWIAALHSGLGLISNPIIGSLSDRFGRGTMLMVTFAASTTGLIALSAAQTIPHFLLVILVITVATSKDALFAAFATDLVPADWLDSAMSAISASRWAGNVIGYATAGYAIHYFGLSWALLAAALLPLGSMLLLLQQRRSQQPGAPALTVEYAQ